MFTGIIEEIGTIERIQKGACSAILSIRASMVTNGSKIGDSIAVNGVCLTITSFLPYGFCADVMHETINRSALIGLMSGSLVNLERAMAANGRFGGHIVAGHVDGTGTITQIKKDDNAFWYTIAASPSITRYIVEKGSIAIDGISLTVADTKTAEFRICAIPHTIRATTLNYRKPGDLVNLETDIIGKYIERFLNFPSGKLPFSEPSGPKKQPETSLLTREFLMKHGFGAGS